MEQKEKKELSPAQQLRALLKGGKQVEEIALTLGLTVTTIRSYEEGKIIPKKLAREKIKELYGDFVGNNPANDKLAIDEI